MQLDCLHRFDGLVGEEVEEGGHPNQNPLLSYLPRPRSCAAVAGPSPCRLDGLPGCVADWSVYSAAVPFVPTWPKRFRHVLLLVVETYSVFFPPPGVTGRGHVLLTTRCACLVVCESPMTACGS